MIRPLLEITTTPPQYEYQITRARLEISQEAPKVDRRTQRASLNMRQQAGRLEMNSVRRRSDMGFKGVVDRANYEADLGRQTALEKTGDYAEIGNQLANIAHGANIPDTLWGQSMKHNQGNLVLVPVSPVDIHYIPASLQTDFQPGQMHADWNIGRAKLNFVPPSFSLNFTQYASINIEYTGGPLYVPPSADPNFVAEA
ncbi:DUF6470 family protein [Ruminococcaceae bacterium OttesenSCG-928-I18]|nr:DUF6470 family protein [Ruminococcaceae bacterium OttesenSCG-928-I18]